MDFYHGTTSSSLENIMRQGFILSNKNPDWSKWLCAFGVYCVLNRPSIAYYFARQRTLIKRDGVPKVIKIPVKMPHRDRILDLTTDEGHVELLKKYLEMKNLYGSVDAFLEIHDDKFIEILNLPNFTMEEKNDYIQSVQDNLRSYRQFKWDCAIITQLVRERNYAIIIAVFQEGDSIAFDVYNHKYEEPDNPSYQGIRFRDSLIACITDLKIIDGSPSTYSEVDINQLQYPENFLSKVSSTRNPKI